MDGEVGQGSVLKADLRKVKAWTQKKPGTQRQDLIKRAWGVLPKGSEEAERGCKRCVPGTARSVRAGRTVSSSLGMRAVLAVRDGQAF